MILYITRKYPPSIGGMQRFNEKLVTNLEKLTKLQLIKWGGSQMFLPFFLIYALTKSLWECLTKDIDCIYISDGLLSPLGLILKILSRKPVIVNIHGSDIAFDFRPYQFLIPRCLKRLNKIICVSNKLKDECIKRNIPESIISVIPNGVDQSDFNIDPDNFPSDNLKEFLNPIPFQYNKILLTVGRLIKVKGVEAFLNNIFPKILKEEDNTIYLIAGSGPEEDTIKRAILKNKLKTQVFLLGEIPMDSGLLAEIYNLADIFIMPNIPQKNKKEGFGIVALESAAAGTPVVASKLDGLTESVIEEKTGFLIKHDDHDAFASKIVDLLQSKDKLQRLSISAKKEVIKRFSWVNIAKKYNSLIH